MDWSTQLLQELERSGGVGAASVQYLRSNRIKLGLREQTSGAQWRPWKRILLRPSASMSDQDLAYTMSLIVHEVRHLQQGWIVALSVYGELDAWQLQFSYLRSLGRETAARVANAPSLEALLALPLNWDRSVLRRGQGLMRAYGGLKYRADLLPLYPFHKEALYRLGFWRPQAAG